MKRTAIGSLIASALLAGCSSTPQTEPQITDVSPGVVRQIGGAVGHVGSSGSAARGFRWFATATAPADRPANRGFVTCGCNAVRRTGWLLTAGHRGVAGLTMWPTG